MEEVHQAKRVVKEWNDKNAEQAGKVFLPVDWSVKAEDVNQADIIVGIIGDWIENPAFVQACIESGKKVILFFQRTHNPEVSISTELRYVDAFKEASQTLCPCFDFNESDEIITLFLSQLRLL